MSVVIYITGTLPIIFEVGIIISVINEKTGWEG